MRNDAEKFQPLGPAKPRDNPKPPQPVARKETNTPLPPVHINDMDMIRKDYGNIPPPWGIFSGTGWNTLYYPIVRFKLDYFRGVE